MSAGELGGDEKGKYFFADIALQRICQMLMSQFGYQIRSPNFGHLENVITNYYVISSKQIGLQSSILEEFIENNIYFSKFFAFFSITSSSTFDHDTPEISNLQLISQHTREDQIWLRAQ